MQFPIHPQPAAPDERAYEEIVTLGRKEAEALVREEWRKGSQPPLDLGQPDRIRPAEFG